MFHMVTLFIQLNLI